MFDSVFKTKLAWSGSRRSWNSAKTVWYKIYGAYWQQLSKIVFITQKLKPVQHCSISFSFCLSFSLACHAAVSLLWDEFSFSLPAYGVHSPWSLFDVPKIELFFWTGLRNLHPRLFQSRLWLLSLFQLHYRPGEYHRGWIYQERHFSAKLFAALIKFSPRDLKKFVRNFLVDFMPY